MNSLLDSIDEDDERPHSGHRGGGDREITLGTTMILLIFFALAVYGAVLFGFGYSLGSKHTATTATAAVGSSGAFGAFKPAPGSPIGSSDSGTMPASDSKPLPFSPPPAVTKTVVPAAEPAEVQSVSSTPDEPRPKPTAAVAATPVAPPPPPPVAAPLAAGIPSVVVQIAALSHAEDAEAVASALKKRGYAVNIQNEPDKLLHVQVGPFASRKDAEAMKARLLADGFNAYIK